VDYIKHWVFSKMDTDLMSRVVLLLELLFIRDESSFLPGLGLDPAEVSAIYQSFVSRLIPHHCVHLIVFFFSLSVFFSRCTCSVFYNFLVMLCCTSVRNKQ
jgi:hypothetical protein